jgi:hypothetical protein
MKYWGYLVAKIAVGLAVLSLLERGIAAMFPPQKAFAQGGPFPALRDLRYDSTMLLFWLFAAALGWLIVWDQRYRCRTCLRRLRMPITKGSWHHVLLEAPRIEYICPFGHGTLKVAELQLTGGRTEWQPHDDIWKELFSLEETEK